MNIWMKGALIGLAISAVIIIFEYMAIKREIAERSERIKKKVDWDSNQKARLRGVMTFGAVVPIGCAVGAWLIWG